VVASISTILGKNNISISSLSQKELKCGDKGSASLLILTHEANEGDLKQSIIEMEKLDCVEEDVVFIRVEDL
jgi:homoserine dehydrogenase